MAVVMGANIAHDIASGSYAEATVASANPDTSELIRSFLDSSKFRTDTTTDVSTVEYCGALKNVVAVGAGEYATKCSFVMVAVQSGRRCCEYSTRCAL
jgi:glycerol-3-phosphate dehydrogenase (NAD+)